MLKHPNGPWKGPEKYFFGLEFSTSVMINGSMVFNSIRLIKNPLKPIEALENSKYRLTGKPGILHPPPCMDITVE